ncbi:DUF2188 domain-containing protein [Caulobacter segnis]
MIVIEVFPERHGWGVRLEGDAILARFQSRDQAERRARWLAVRETVRDGDAEVRLLDGNGAIVGRWIDEGYLETKHIEQRAA